MTHEELTDHLENVVEKMRTRNERLRQQIRDLGHEPAPELTHVQPKSAAGHDGRPAR